jgi:putative ABC transport system substrate-binding protein
VDSVRQLSRRRLIGSLAGVAVSTAGLALVDACGLIAAPSAPPKLPRIGYFTPVPFSLAAANVEGFRQGLRDNGWFEGQTISIEWRSADGQAERLPEMAAELVRLNLDVIVAVTSGVAAVQQATRNIPIVMIGVNPVAQGFAVSFARPGGNMTGNANPDLSSKKLELLSQVAPGLSRLAVFVDPTYPPDSASTSLSDIQAAARARNIQVQSLVVRTPQEIDVAFEAAARGHAEALMDAASSLLVSTERARIFDFSVKMRLPGTWRTTQWVVGGGLMAYGANQPGQQRRAAGYVDRILRGAKPADLPITLPTEYDFAVNLKTAQTLGLTIPPNVALQVTDWIQ